MIEGVDVISVDLYENEEKGILYRFMISEFREKYYIGIREWYLDYEGELNNYVLVRHDNDFLGSAKIKNNMMYAMLLYIRKL